MDKKLFKEQFIQFYEIDINNCVMTNEQWVNELVDALSDKDYLKKFSTEFKKYKEFINQ